MQQAQKTTINRKIQLETDENTTYINCKVKHDLLLIHQLLCIITTLFYCGFQRKVIKTEFPTKINPFMFCMQGIVCRVGRGAKCSWQHRMTITTELEQLYGLMLFSNIFVNSSSSIFYSQSDLKLTGLPVLFFYFYLWYTIY